MSSVTEFLKVNAKALVAALAGIVLTAVQDVIAGNQPFPTSFAEWAKYLGTAVVSGMIVWATGNKATQKQVIKGAAEQGISVITQTGINVVTHAAENAVQQALPEATPQIIRDVSTQVSGTINQVMKGVAANFDLKLEDVL